LDYCHKLMKVKALLTALFIVIILPGALGGGGPMNILD
jgi:hypothetical protein